MSETIEAARPVQRISKIRRDYNRWVADESLEDYALRFAPRSFRKWSAFRVANTAFGAVSFLALEAIGAAITLSYGFTNAMWAIGVVGLVIFLTGLPIAYRAARHGLDMDLLTRGAGFGYLGSTLTSLIYAGFTFIFFALEAAIMAQALELWFGMPRPIGYLVSALAVIPLVMHGITLISRLQLWTQPLWLALLALPFVAVALKDPGAFVRFGSLNGRSEDGSDFSWAAFGAAATVAASLIAQIGEQVDFLRFMPEPTPRNRVRWWLAVIVAGPGWILLGAAKMVGGAFLAFLALQHEVPIARVLEPTTMYLAGFEYALGPGMLAIAATGVFVIVSQVKINVTNAYAGSLAWSNFFARLTHSHPGRVVWLVFNVLISMLLMAMGVFEALEQVLGLYAHLAVAWVGAIVGDLTISKPLGLSPRQIEFRRAYLYDINPSGFGAMLVASALSVGVYLGLFGDTLRPASAAIALGASLCLAPMIAAVTRRRFFMARTPADFGARHATLRCVVCRNRFEADDMARCPAYGGVICSLCCTLDARCGDRCKPGARMHEQIAPLLARLLPGQTTPTMVRRIGLYLLVLGGMVTVIGSTLWLLHAQEALRAHATPAVPAALDPHLDALFLKVFAALLMLAAVASWWLVLVNETRHVAQQESERQNQLLMREIDAHRHTDALLQAAKETAESANLAKSRFLTGMSHEMRSPLNSILGYSQVLLRQDRLGAEERAAIGTIRRSGEHLGSLVDGLLELSRIEAGKLRLEREPLDLADFLAQIRRMFEPQAQEKGLAFHFEIEGRLPPWVNADPKRLRQILINLLGNAVKFTRHGAVRVRVRYLREIAHIEVADTGIGIAAADHQRIFQPFERLPSGAAIEGTGLGLTITRLLVDLMGGDLRLDSAPGAGSRFTIRLYLPAIDGYVSPTAGTGITGYQGRRQTVLVVDDEPAHRAVLRQTLAPLGFDVYEAETGAGCLACARSLQPDLVLLDVNLPDAAGWDVAGRLRGQHAHAPRIVMVSANVHENTPAARTAAGVNGFVAKPFAETDLLEAIRDALGLTWTLAPVASPEPPLADLPADVARELLALSARGHHRALVARLAEMADESDALAAWGRRLASLQARDSRMLRDTLMEVLNAAARR
ncbi:MAG TPA: ATP-binding protein [Quisquiliibacterium sp.]|nr:ATP-binding protein [Quisquiliibacterium sp.]